MSHPTTWSWRETEMMKFKWTQSMQKWWQRAVFVCVSMWTGAWLHLENVGAEPLELSSITPSHCPLTRAAKVSWSQRPQHYVWRLATWNPHLACTCGLRRILWEAITWSRVMEQNPDLPLGCGPFLMWGWVSVRVQCGSQKSSTQHCYTATCTTLSRRHTGCICSLIGLLWHLQQDLTLREYDCMVVVSHDGYLTCHSIHFGSGSVRFHRY